MSQSMIEKLFDGEIYPSEQIKPSSPKYKELARLIDETQMYFLNSLSNADRERFVELTELYGKIQSILAFEDFSHGYKLGVRLTSEAFIDPKEPPSEKE